MKLENKQQRILDNLDTLSSLTVNFPGLLEQAVASSLVNCAEKQAIIQHYNSIGERLKTLYLVCSGKSTDAFDRLIEVLQNTGNNKAANILLDSEGEGVGKMDEVHRSLILRNVDKLSTHSMNLPMVFSYASGMELITGKEREVIMETFSSTNERFAEFFKLTTKKGPTSYEKLVKVLKMTQNHWALDVLQYEDENKEDYISN